MERETEHKSEIHTWRKLLLNSLFFSMGILPDIYTLSDLESQTTPQISVTSLLELNSEQHSMKIPEKKKKPW